jgi:hypothetical protein
MANARMMKQETEELIKDNRETLEIVANADLPASWVAQELLESVEGQSSYSEKEPNRDDIQETNEPQKPIQEESEPERSVFAY